MPFNPRSVSRRYNNRPLPSGREEEGTSEVMMMIQMVVFRGDGSQTFILELSKLNSITVLIVPDMMSAKFLIFDPLIPCPHLDLY